MLIVDTFREETVRWVHLDLQGLQDLQELRVKMASRAYLAPMEHQERKVLVVTRVTKAVPVTAAFLVLKGPKVRLDPEAKKDPKESMVFLGTTEIKARAD